MTQPRKILIVDDHPIVCQGLRRIIDAESDLQVCGVANDVPGALASIDAQHPDVAVVDITLASGDGLELIKTTRHRHPELLTLVLSMHDESLYGERALRAGARGYLMKKEASERILEALRQILAGQIFASPELRTRMLEEAMTGAPATEDPIDRLSDRELQIFRLIGLGHGTRQIADDLHLSVKTVESHRQHIKQKLGLRSATQLVRHAVHWHETRGELGS
jgi:DNA-binding NarL/FixJ family response regulator